jgi:hypothetical protein
MQNSSRTTLSIENNSGETILHVKYLNKYNFQSDWGGTVSSWLDYFKHNSNAKNEFGHSYPVIFVFRSISKNL